MIWIPEQRWPDRQREDCLVTSVLAAWRRRVHAEPVRVLVDVDTAMAVVAAAAQGEW